MAVAYTTYTDCNNKYLSDVGGDKVTFTGATDATPLLESAGRIIRARLSGYFEASYIATWQDPTTTPEIIQEIAAKLASALQYRRRASEDVPDSVSAYAQELYDEAMNELGMITTGDLEISDQAPVVTGTMNLTELHFYPNDTIECGTPDDIKFQIGAVW